MQDALFCTVSPVVLLHCKSRKEPEHAGTLRLLYCPAATGEHTSADQQPECTSRVILILLSCGTVRVCTPAGSLNRHRSLQHHPQCVAAYSQAGSIPSCPASCRCGQLRTDRESPAVQMGGFFDTPGPAKHPGVVLYPAPSDRYPAPEKSPGVCRKGTGSIRPARICAGFSFTVSRRCAAWAIRVMPTVN